MLNCNAVMNLFFYVFKIEFFLKIFQFGHSNFVNLAAMLSQIKKIYFNNFRFDKHGKVFRVADYAKQQEDEKNLEKPGKFTTYYFVKFCQSVE